MRGERVCYRSKKDGSGGGGGGGGGGDNGGGDGYEVDRAMTTKRERGSS